MLVYSILESNVFCCLGLYRFFFISIRLVSFFLVLGFAFCPYSGYRCPSHVGIATSTATVPSVPAPRYFKKYIITRKIREKKEVVNPTSFAFSPFCSCQGEMNVTHKHSEREREKENNNRF